MPYDSKEKVKAYYRVYNKKNRVRLRDAAREWSRKNAHRIAFGKRRRRYNITEDEVNKLLDVQKNSCAICLSPFNGKFHIDHDHDASYVRGLLCQKCNQGLGLFRDSVTFMMRACTYLERLV